MELYERLLKIADFFEEKSQTQLARRLSVPQSTFYDYLNPVGQSKIRKVLLDKINQVYPEINRDWLYFGEGEMLVETPETPPTPAVAAPDLTAPLVEKSRAVPMVGFASCGIIGWQGTMTFPVSVTAPHWRPGMFGVTASGDSMIPAGIGNGHVCFCDPNAEPLEGECVYVARKDGTSALKLFLGRVGVGGAPGLRFCGWLDKDAAGQQKLFTLDERADRIQVLAPVIYVQRRM